MEGEQRLIKYLSRNGEEVTIGERILVNGEPLSDLDEVALRSLYHLPQLDPLPASLT